MYYTHNSEDTFAFGQALGACLQKGDSVLLYGDLGTGKSVLARGCARALGVTDAMAAHYDDEIKQAGGVDLQLLGIGPNGHIGFNEPGTPWDAVTHIVPLTDATRQANKRFFNSIDEVPEKAVSMGIKTVMQSRRISLMAFGKNKAQAVKGMIEGRIDNSVPASILQLHPDCTVYIDDDAASML